MRKVLFNKWIPKETIKDDSNGGPLYTERSVKGTNCWEKGFPNEGLFHAWGTAYEEFESGPGNYTVGIVELPDGTIEQVLPCNIKFVKEAVEKTASDYLSSIAKDPAIKEMFEKDFREFLLTVESKIYDVELLEEMIRFNQKNITDGPKN